MSRVNFSALILASSTFLSAILGLWRDRLLAATFGAGQELDIYAAAFRIPDLVYNLLIIGGLSVAFLPVLADAFHQGKDQAWKMTSNILNIFLLFLTVLSTLFFILAPWLVDLIAPGFSIQAKTAVVDLSRLLFLSPIFFGAANIFSGILQYFQKFLVIGLAPILYNLGIILGIVFLAPNLGIWGVGWGVILGAFAHFLLQFGGVKSCGFSWKPIFDFQNQAIWQIFRLGFWRMLASFAQQINLWVMTALASTVSLGAVSVFYFANNLQGLAVSLIGLSLAGAVFPLLAKAVAEQNIGDLSKNFTHSFWQIVFLALPASVVIFVWREELVRLILGSGRFDQAAIQLTAACLGIFALSIFAQAEIPLLLRTFFSLKESKKPALISAAAMIANVLLSIVLVEILRRGSGFSPLLGLPLAFSISAAFQFCLLLVFLKKKLKTIDTNA
jgi:putative peptidoglycan lipid II flippase